MVKKPIYRLEAGTRFHYAGAEWVATSVVPHEGRNIVHASTVNKVRREERVFRPTEMGMTWVRTVPPPE